MKLSHKFIKAFIVIITFAVCASSCDSKSSRNIVSDINDTIYVTTKYLEIAYPNNIKLSKRYINNTIEFLSLSNENGDNVEFIIFPFLVPTYDLFTTFLIKDYRWLNKNNRTIQNIEDFCDSTYWNMNNKSCYSFYNRFEGGCINVLSSNSSTYSVYSSFIEKDSIPTFLGITAKLNYDYTPPVEVRNLHSDSIRTQFIANITDSVNNIIKPLDNFPVNICVANNINHTFTIKGDFDKDYLVGKVGSGYFIDTMWFLTEYNPFLGLSLYYVEDNSLLPYTIILENNLDEIVSQWQISELFDQRNFMNLWSRIRD